MHHISVGLKYHITAVTRFSRILNEYERLDTIHVGDGE